MSITRHYLQDKNFMMTRITGNLNDNILMEHVNELNRMTLGLSNLRELADCRKITGADGLTVQGTADCAKTELDRPESLLAILVNDSTLLYGMARAYHTFSEEKRKRIQVLLLLNPQSLQHNRTVPVWCKPRL